MSDNIRLRGKYYYYDLMIDGKRYKGTTKTTDKKLAEQIVSTIKTDILRKKHDLPSVINYRFKDLWELYISLRLTTEGTREVRINASKHFLPVFANFEINKITPADLEKYKLKRKIEIFNLPKNKTKREQDISFNIIYLHIF